VEGLGGIGYTGTVQLGVQPVTEQHLVLVFPATMNDLELRLADLEVTYI
jgi:hypothetical protein